MNDSLFRTKDVVQIIKLYQFMSKTRSTQPNGVSKDSQGANKDKNVEYFAPQAINSISDQQNLYYPKDGSSLIPEFPEGLIQVQLGLQKGKQAYPQKGAQSTRQKRKRQMNAHVVNPNALMVLQPSENQTNQLQGASSTASSIRPSSGAYNPEQKFQQKMSLDTQKVSVKPQQSNFVVLEEDQEEQSGQPNNQMTKLQKYIEQRQKRFEKNTLKRKQPKVQKSAVFLVSAQESAADQKSVQNTTFMETNVKNNLNDSSAVIIHEPENKIIHMVPSRGTVSSFAFSRQKIFWRNFINPEYILNQRSGEFVVNAKKQYGHFNSYYSISSLRKEFSDNEMSFLGYLQGNFSGSEFNLYQKKLNREQLVATICYKTDFGCSSTYRTMEIYIKNPTLNDLENQKGSLKQLYSRQQNSESGNIIKLVNKQPIWCQNMQCFTLNFHGKSKYGSIKNTILIEEGNPRDQIMLFCKTDLHQFLLEIRNPLTPFLAMGIVLSSFDFKLCCQ